MLTERYHQKNVREMENVMYAPARKRRTVDIVTGIVDGGEASEPDSEEEEL